MSTPVCRLGRVTLGVVLGPVTVWLLPRLARAQASLAAMLLSPGTHVRLVERAHRLAVTRARVVDAQAAELRRIEHDLHDGAQAWIVAAGMTLALASRKLRGSGADAGDVDLARGQLDEALPSCGTWSAASTRRSSPTEGCTPGWRRWRPTARSTCD